MRRTTSDYEAATFVIRLWRETPEENPEERPWRGTAVHVQSGTERNVQGLEDLLSFMQLWVTTPSAEDDVMLTSGG